MDFHSTFVSVPADFGGLSVDAYLSGIIAGVLEGAGFPARVTAHTVTLEEGEAAPVSAHAAASSTSLSSPSSSSSAAAAAALSYYGSSFWFPASLPPRKEKTVFLVKFAPSVLARDVAMA